MGVLDQLMSFSSDIPEAITDENRPNLGRGKGVIYTRKQESKSEIFLENISKNGYDIKDLEEIFKTRGNQLILAGAGAGKTTSMVYKVIYDTLSGELTKKVKAGNSEVRVLDRVWISTFLKTGAMELEEKLREVQDDYHTLNMASIYTFSTLHAEFYALLVQLGIHIEIISDSQARSNLRKVLKNLHIKSRGKFLNSEQINDLESALTYTRNRLDYKRYDVQTYQDLGLTSIQVDSIIESDRQLRQEQGVVDFEDLQEQIYQEAVVNPNPKVIEEIQKRYNYIYLDEFQDVSQIQYEVLKVYAAKAKKVVAIGDDDQTIYSWRGSDHTIITEKFENDFSPTVFKLGVNYRCPNNILKAIIPSIEKNTARHPKKLESSQKGGETRIGYFPNLSSMSDRLVELIKEDLVEGLSVAVLCRVNSDGLIPAIALDQANTIDFTLNGQGMTLGSGVGRAALDVVKLMTQKGTPAVERALKQLTYEDWEVRKLVKVCKEERKFFWDMSDQDLLYSCPSIGRALVSWKYHRQELGDIETLKYLLNYYQTKVYTGESQYVSVVRTALQSISHIIENGNFLTPLDVLIETEDINTRLEARARNKFMKKNVPVTVTTVHDFKGKERDSIYIYNASEDVFPHKSSVGTLEDYEEERRIWYIGNTRGKVKSTILALEGKASPFIEEMQLLDATRVDRAKIRTGRL